MPDGSDVSIKDQINRNAVIDRLQTYLAEFTAMRSEIVHLSAKQNNLLVASFAVSGYAFTYPEKLRPEIGAYAIVALALCGLGILYCDCDRAVIRCATYIDKHLRNELHKLTNDEHVLEWERYIRGDSQVRELAEFPHPPLNAGFQCAFIFLPALVSMVLFGYSYVHQFSLLSHGRLAALTLLAVGSLIAIAFFFVRLIFAVSNRLDIPVEKQRHRIHPRTDEISS